MLMLEALQLALHQLSFAFTAFRSPSTPALSVSCPCSELQLAISSQCALKFLGCSWCCDHCQAWACLTLRAAALSWWHCSTEQLLHFTAATVTAWCSACRLGLRALWSSWPADSTQHVAPHLQEAAVAAEDLAAGVADHVQEPLGGEHDGAVRDAGVTDHKVLLDALHRGSQIEGHAWEGLGLLPLLRQARLLLLLLDRLQPEQTLRAVPTKLDEIAKFCWMRSTAVARLRATRGKALGCCPFFARRAFCCCCSIVCSQSRL